ncbi:MAG TPA: MAPEG family protein [Allosphingosinicella sp.]|nr:MAPEG family protein [Allosphingosinicella sp.]
MILPITLTIAGAAALLNLWLGRRVGQMRLTHKVSIGDGGNEALIARMRAQANFIEYTPFVLILIGLIELAEGSRLWLWIVGVVYILARIAHGFGMDRRHPDPLRLRMIGIIVTALILLGLALYAIVLPYIHREPARVTYAAASSFSPGGTNAS